MTIDESQYTFTPIAWTNSIIKDAKVLIVGITPGNSQSTDNNSNDEEAKKKNAFCGSMRDNLVLMLNKINLNKVYGLSCCSQFWENDNHIADFTSILKNATYYNGKMLNNLKKLHKEKRLIEEYTNGFLKDIAEQYTHLEIIIALGKQVYQEIEELKNKNIIQNNVKIICIPHPSGANMECINSFCDKIYYNANPTRAKRKNSKEMFSQAKEIISNIK